MARATSRQGSRIGAEFLGSGLRAGCGRGCPCDAALWLACGLLCWRSSSIDHALGAKGRCRARDLEARTGTQPATWTTVSREAWTRSVGLRHDECGHALCVVGIVYLGAELSFTLHSGRRPRPE